MLHTLGHFRGIHWGFIAHCYRGRCPAVTLCKAESCTLAAGLIVSHPRGSEEE
jgi:hypothetical protein